MARVRILALAAIWITLFLCLTVAFCLHPELAEQIGEGALGFCIILFWVTLALND